MVNELAVIDDDIKGKIIVIRGKPVILDRDAAAIYGIETKDVNRAVKNNLDKFPERYLIPLDNAEKDELVKNFHRFDPLKHSDVAPKAFTEQGLYMLATILKSKRAAAMTMHIIDTFAQIKEMSRNLLESAETAEPVKKTSLLRRGSEILTEVLNGEMKDADKIDTETTFELNFSVLKVKRTVKTSKKRE